MFRRCAISSPHEAATQSKHLLAIFEVFLATRPRNVRAEMPVSSASKACHYVFVIPSQRKSILSEYHGLSLDKHPHAPVAHHVTLEILERFWVHVQYVTSNTPLINIDACSTRSSLASVGIYCSTRYSIWDVKCSAWRATSRQYT